MILFNIDRILGFKSGLPPTIALFGALIGIVLLFAGWRFHRLALAFTGLVAGVCLGKLAAGWFKFQQAWGMAVGGTLLTILSGPLHRIFVFLLCGLGLGGMSAEILRFLGLHVWIVWGMLPGFIIGGVLSIWMPRAFMILATSFLGSALITWGGPLAIGKWFYHPAKSFCVRHPIGATVMVVLFFLVGSSIQFRFSPERHEDEEDSEE